MTKQQSKKESTVQSGGTKDAPKSEASDSAIKERERTVSFFKIYSGKKSPVDAKRIESVPKAMLATEKAHKSADEAGEGAKPGQEFEVKFTHNSGSYSVVVTLE